MPGKDSGESVNIFGRIATLAVVMLLILLLILRANAVAPKVAPTPFIQPTSTFLSPGSALLPERWIDVVASADQSNPFDSFDVNEVVLRTSNLSAADDGADGRFLVPPCASGQYLYAWAPGYEIRSVPCDNIPERIELTHLKAVDNKNYIWSAAANDCINCHSNRLDPIEPTLRSYDEMNEWLKSGHGKVFAGKYFENMYMGTSFTGRTSIPAQPIIIDNEWVPVPAEISALYHGPGYRLDYPPQPGNCAYCHAPASIPTTQDGVDLYYLFPKPGGAWGEGVTCDICHKAFEVILADDGYPFPDKPGTLSYRFLRPETGGSITGPFSNLMTISQLGPIPRANHQLTCTPQFSRSEFCAPCHFGKFGDMVVYNSYGEWKRSAFAQNPADSGYRTCQDCHMSHLKNSDQTSLWSQRQACSANNLQFQNFSHNMMDFGIYDNPDTLNDIEIPRMVIGAARINVSFDRRSADVNALDVNVNVRNTEAGHKFPTDSPLRHLILVVWVKDRVNTSLIQVGGERIPNWAGPGPISLGHIAEMENAGIKDYSGLPGKIFANLLIEEETNLSPGMAYWNETKYAFIDSANGNTSDTRLAPGKPDLSTYSFAMPDEGDVTVIVELYYRYAFYDLAVWKEWFDPQRADILVTRVRCEGSPRDPVGMRCNQTVPLTPTPTPTTTP